MILGMNQSFQVGDNDFSKLSFIPGGILLHKISSSVPKTLVDEGIVIVMYSKANVHH